MTLDQANTTVSDAELITQLNALVRQDDPDFSVVDWLMLIKVRDRLNELSARRATADVTEAKDAAIRLAIQAIERGEYPENAVWDEVKSALLAALNPPMGR